VVTTLATWRLGAPISRAVVVAATGPGGDQLIILGGATTGGLTASGAFALDVTTGTLTQVGDLMTTLDDAAGAVIDGQDVVFGGTTATLSAPTTSVQALSGAPATGSTPSGSAVPTSTALGTLPQPRAAATAVTAGTTTYIVGGANEPESDVLATTDGRHFDVVASLPVPVQFPAVAVSGGKLYVFGGVATSGGDAGRPVSTIQVVNLKTHKVSAAGHLPEPLTGAAAVVLGHDVLVAGGDTSPGVPAQSVSRGSTTTAPTTASSSVSTVWSYDTTRGTCTIAGHLPVAVSHAGVALLGATAWLVGGESDGTPVSAVQSFVTAPSPS
jgi:N-acetylneuraminic acid mutarotase